MSTKTQVQWRRTKVLELSSQGWSQMEIANHLQVDEPTISRDLSFLRRQAQENLQKHIHQVVPAEYEKCMVGIKSNLKETLQIAQTVTDPRVKLQARAIVNDCYHYIMDLCTNVGIINDALEFIEKKNSQLKRIKELEKEKEELDNKKEKEEREEESAGVF